VVHGEDVASTIMATASANQITQIVLGTSKLSRWQSLTRGSVIQQILRMASDEAIDVHVIARLTERSGRPPADDES
jgi:two-component system sensor histidine kinase KdpD